MREMALSTFHKKVIPMANNQMKRYSSSLFLRQMHIKNAMKYHHPLIRMAKIKD